MATIFALVAREHSDISNFKRPQLRFDENKESEYDFGLGTKIFESRGKRRSWM